MLVLPEEAAASVLAATEDIVDPKDRNKHVEAEVVQVQVVDEKEHKIKDWLEEQKLRTPIPDEPLDDAAIGLTYRSMETTTSSVS